MILLLRVMREQQKQPCGGVAMGKFEEAESIPDTYGLPEFFVTDIQAEVMGSNVRLTCGSRQGRSVQWRYTVILPAEQLMRIGRQCTQAAEEALNLMQMMDRQKGH
jgi:hypothetical protein